MHTTGESPTLTLEHFESLTSGATLGCIAVVQAGEPVARVVYVAMNESGTHVTFATESGSRLDGHAVLRQSASLTVFDSQQGWGVEHAGVFMFGRLESPPSDQAALQAYIRRFPAARASLETGELKLLCFAISSLQIVDERVP